MSTYLYLECREHAPAVSSDGEVGQHLYDLPDIRKLIAHRDLLVAVRAADLDVDYGHHFANNAARFLCEHPNCRLGIRDEYGHEHPVVEEPEDPRVPAIQAAVVEAMNVVGEVLLPGFKPFTESPLSEADVKAALSAVDSAIGTSGEAS